jgi:hypothetical protein
MPLKISKPFAARTQGLGDRPIAFIFFERNIAVGNRI